MALPACLVHSWFESLPLQSELPAFKIIDSHTLAFVPKSADMGISTK